jgi:hypothetical protein
MRLHLTAAAWRLRSLKQSGPPPQVRRNRWADEDKDPDAAQSTRISTLGLTADSVPRTLSTAANLGEI